MTNSWNINGRRRPLPNLTNNSVASPQLATANNTTSKVDHPAHYNRENGMECLDEMELVFGREAVRTFCLLNCWKYRYRAADKNGEEDLKKSDWYLRKYAELGGDN